MHVDMVLQIVSQVMQEDRAGRSMTDVLISGQPPDFKDQRYMFEPGADV
jgi:hypothetical protein